LRIFPLNGSLSAEQVFSMLHVYMQATAQGIRFIPEYYHFELPYWSQKFTSFQIYQLLTYLLKV